MSLAVFAVVILAGCDAPEPASYYVDVDRVLAATQPREIDPVRLPDPPGPTAPVTVSQPGLPATRTTDRTLERLEMAKRLIQANRGKSIAALSTMLKRVYIAQANDTIEKQSRELRPEQEAIFEEAFGGLRTLFEEYGARRGPLLAQLSALVRNTDLQDQEIPTDATVIEKSIIPRANAVRADIRALDLDYEARADLLLDDAYRQINAEIVRLQAEARRMRAEAEDRAVREAEEKATATQTEIDVQLRELVPDSLPAVPARQVVVPGAPSLPAAPTDTSAAIFGSLGQRIRLIDQEIDIWIRTTGRIRSLSPEHGIDATEEFLQWRRAHTVGP